MSAEQVTRYGSELSFGAGHSDILRSLGNTMFEASYIAKAGQRVSYTIGRLNGRRGESAQTDELINQILHRIRTGGKTNTSITPTGNEGNIGKQGV